MTTEIAIMCGLPRSGKTTYAKELQKQGWTRVCPDEIRLALHGEAFIGRAEPFVWAIAETMARALLLGGHRVVIDAVNSTVERRRQWVCLAREFHKELQIYVVPTPYEVCLKRRGDLELHVLERMNRQFEQPTSDEGTIIMAVLGVGGLVQVTEG